MGTNYGFIAYTLKTNVLTVRIALQDEELLEEKAGDIPALAQIYQLSKKGSRLRRKAAQAIHTLCTDRFAETATTEDCLQVYEDIPHNNYFASARNPYLEKALELADIEGCRQICTTSCYNSKMYKKAEQKEIRLIRESLRKAQSFGDIEFIFDSCISIPTDVLIEAVERGFDLASELRHSKMILEYLKTQSDRDTFETYQERHDTRCERVLENASSFDAYWNVYQHSISYAHKATALSGAIPLTHTARHHMLLSSCVGHWSNTDRFKTTILDTGRVKVQERIDALRSFSACWFLIQTGLRKARWVPPALIEKALTFVTNSTQGAMLSRIMNHEQLSFGKCLFQEVNTKRYEVRANDIEKAQTFEEIWKITDDVGRNTDQRHRALERAYSLARDLEQLSMVYRDVCIFNFSDLIPAIIKRATLLTKTQQVA